MQCCWHEMLEHKRCTQNCNQKKCATKCIMTFSCWQKGKTHWLTHVICMLMWVLLHLLSHCSSNTTLCQKIISLSGHKLRKLAHWNDNSVKQCLHACSLDFVQDIWHTKSNANDQSETKLQTFLLLDRTNCEDNRAAVHVTTTKHDAVNHGLLKQTSDKWQLIGIVAGNKNSHACNPCMWSCSVSMRSQKVLEASNIASVAFSVMSHGLSQTGITFEWICGSMIWQTRSVFGLGLPWVVDQRKCTLSSAQTQLQTKAKHGSKPFPPMSQLNIAEQTKICC